MSAGSLGTPALARSTSASVTGSWGSGQTRTVGDMLVAMVSAGGSTASAAAISTPSGWTQVTTTGNTTGTAHAWVAAYTKVATGGDVEPVFTATLSGTVAMTVTLFELPAACNNFPVDATGTYSSGGSSGSLTAMTAQTSTSVSATGGYGISVFCQNAGTAVATWNGGTGWTNAASDGTTSSVMHTAVDFQAAPAFNAALSETGHWGYNTSAYGAGLVLVIAAQSGGFETYTNIASCAVTAGGTTAPAAGTPEYWTASWAGFPVASNTTFPPTKFHVNDPAAPGGEVIAVLSTTTGLVIRGANGTTPVAHTAGFTVENVLTAESSANVPQVYSIRQYGATGNGVTDDFIPLQQALTACRLAGGGTVQVPAGTYITSQIPQVGSNTRLAGDGKGASVIRVISGMNPVQVGGQTGLNALQVWAEQSASCILVEDITFDGNQAGNPSPTSPFNLANSAAIRLDNVDRLRLHDVEVVNAIAYSVLLNECTHIDVSGCEINMSATAFTGADGITAADCTAGVITANTVTGNSTPGSDGILIVGVASGAVLASGLAVTGNTLTGWAVGIIELNAGNNPDYNVIQGNDLHGCTTGTTVLGAHTLCQQGVPDIGGIPDTEQFCFLASAYTLTSSTSAQKLFNASAAGTLTVPAATAFFFECEFDLTSLSATSGTFSFSFGGTATYTAVKYFATAQKSAAVSTLATWPSAVITTASATALVAASTTTTGAARLSGIIRTNAAGTLVPTITLSQASAAVVGAGSWFRIWPAGSSTTTTAGYWT